MTSYLKRKLSWISYDFANSSYHLMIPTILFPLLFKNYFFAGENSDFWWSLTVAAPILISGLASPFIGAHIDSTGKKKLFFCIFALLAIFFCIIMGLVPKTFPLLIVAVFICSLLFFNLSQFVYNSFLPNIVSEEKVSITSGLGWGLGYLGGILCLFLIQPLIKDASPATSYINYQLSFAITGIFFLIFAIPALLWVNESSFSKIKINTNPFQIVKDSLKNWDENKNIFIFLFSLYLINDAISTLVFFTSIYASTTLKLATSEIMKAFLIVQSVAIPATIFISWLASKISIRIVFISTIIAWLINSIGFYIVRDVQDFYHLSISVGLVIGTTPALGRAILALIMDKSKAAEFYGFHTLSTRISSVAGPLLFGLISYLTNNQRLAISSIGVFFLIGLYLFAKVTLPLKQK